jgi:aspartate aminotransferase
MADVKLASRMATMSESATLALNARVKQMAAAGQTIYNLTAGELGGDTPDYIQKAVAEKLKFNKYTPVPGLPELRQAIADNARQFYGLDWIKPENVVVTAATKPGMYASWLALLEPDDEVIVPIPAWGSHLKIIEIAGGKAVTVPLTETYDLNVQAIAAKITPRTKAILINSPHNPTGGVYSKKALNDLAKLLKGSGIFVMSDDIYAKLVYDDDFSLPASHGFENLIIINGFSKSQAITGWRIGYMIAKQPLAEAATKILSHITGNAPLPGQYAALAALERGDRPPKETMELLKRQRQIVVDSLAKLPGLKHNIPGGAFYVFLDLRQLTDNSAEWCERLLMETGVALVPGEAFEAPGFARLTFVTDEVTLRAALGAITGFVEGAPA